MLEALRVGSAVVIEGEEVCQYRRLSFAWPKLESRTRYFLLVSIESLCLISRPTLLSIFFVQTMRGMPYVHRALSAAYVCSLLLLQDALAYSHRVRRFQCESRAVTFSEYIASGRGNDKQLGKAILHHILPHQPSHRFVTQSLNTTYMIGSFEDDDNCIKSADFLLATLGDW